MPQDRTRGDFLLSPEATESASLSGIEGSALCEPPFPQVTGDRKGRRDAFKQPTGMRSSIVALTRTSQRPVPADGIAPAAAGCAAGSWQLADLLFSPMAAMTDNHLPREGGAMPRLDDTAVAEGLQRLPGWKRRGNQIVKTFVRDDFAHAMVFVNEVASAAEAAGHHPDIDIRWNTVTLALSSHDKGGLTENDFQLAARIQELDQPTQPA
jgi:4a-hydroxytetrahydrobiopterin dehydratase